MKALIYHDPSSLEEFYVVKYRNGTAYYLCHKRDFLNNVNAYTIWHILSGKSFPANNELGEPMKIQSALVKIDNDAQLEYMSFEELDDKILMRFGYKLGTAPDVVLEEEDTGYPDLGTAEVCDSVPQHVEKKVRKKHEHGLEFKKKRFKKIGNQINILFAEYLALEAELYPEGNGQPEKQTTEEPS